MQQKSCVGINTNVSIIAETRAWAYCISSTVNVRVKHATSRAVISNTDGKHAPWLRVSAIFNSPSQRCSTLRPFQQRKRHMYRLVQDCSRKLTRHHVIMCCSPNLVMFLESLLEGFSTNFYVLQVERKSVQQVSSRAWREKKWSCLTTASGMNGKEHEILTRWMSWFKSISILRTILLGIGAMLSLTLTHASSVRHFPSRVAYPESSC